MPLRFAIALALFGLTACVPPVATTPAGDRQAEQPGLVTYDRIRDVTTVSSERIRFGRRVHMGQGVYGQRYGLLATATHPGEARRPATAAELEIVAAGVVLSSGRYWQHARDSVLTLLLNGQTRIHVQRTAYDSTVIGGLAVENLHFAVSPSLIDSIGTATSVEGAIGDESFAFTEADRRVFAAFARRVSGSEP